METFANTSHMPLSNFAAAITWLRSRLEPDIFNLACVVIWNVWNYRNKVIHGSDAGASELLIPKSRDFLESFSSARFNFELPKESLPAASWRPPSHQFVKVNYDAAVYDSGVYQVGVVVRDTHGQIIRWQARRFQGNPSLVAVEATAARQALIMAREMGWSHVHIEGDCLEVGNALKDQRDDCFREFGVIISACREFISLFDCFISSFIRRVGNSLAHALAHISLSDCFELYGYSVRADLAYLI